LSSVVGVIPVRFGATRFPGKPLAPILKKPMLEWVLKGVSQSKKIDEIMVATDHEGIAEVAVQLGYKVKMTDSDLPSGSDRVWAAIAEENFDIVVNIQGDEPLIRGDVLDALVTEAQSEANKDFDMWTLGHELTHETLMSQQCAKVVVGKQNQALYFSRLPIPFSRKSYEEFQTIPCLKHIGIYAYHKKFLKRFCDEAPPGIENAEGLEQLRALYLGGRVQVVKTNHDCWGVDIPSDIQKIEKILLSQGQ
jgi:3-deoxy-manno-octulosonate cytidylyltransferase (CMP-KDO synthetase)